MSLVSLPQTVRSLARLRIIAQVLTKHGFGHIVERVQLRRYIPLPSWLIGPPPDAFEPDLLRSVGQRLVRVCEELGPTFVKLGQLAAGRPDILPPVIATELSRLQDDVAPFPSAQARRCIADAIGKPIEAIFRSFDDAPYASGSIAQVHRAVTADGQEVVVKVRRPEIDSVIHLDVTILRWLAGAIENHIPELRFARPRVLVDEFARAITRELDFVNEASFTTRFADAFADDPHVRIPAVRWDLTESNVLTLEYLTGLSLREVQDDPKCGVDRASAAKHLATCFMRQFFDLGLFHADPHPGNLLFIRPDRVGLIDFGNAGQIEEELSARLVIALVGTIRKEVDLIIDVLADTGALGANTNRDSLRRDLREMLEKYYGLPLRRLELGAIFFELMEISRRNDVTLPREFVQLGRSLVAVAGVALQLDPELNLLEIIVPRLRRTLLNHFSGGRVLRELGFGLWHLLNILREAPRLIRDILRRAGRGQFQVNIRHQNLDYLASEVDRSSNRMAFSILMASTVIGSSMLISMNRSETIMNLPIRYLGVVGYLISFVMAVWLVIAILRSGKLS
ncbi:MAG: AarF/ABC1/UbiB kinase family protein [Phycisphaerae bacterium]|nr:AarF/ABC1/UbiB kinase family protein [Phycisphaerae bacterium]